MAASQQQVNKGASKYAVLQACAKKMSRWTAAQESKQGGVKRNGQGPLQIQMTGYALKIADLGKRALNASRKWSARHLTCGGFGVAASSQRLKSSAAAAS
jgi:hypothetical protein